MIMALKNYPDEANAAGFRGLPKPQKIAVAVLAALAAFIVFFWIWQMRAQIRQPFEYEAGDKPNTSDSSANLNSFLQERDTDNDGLSDYDEIYIHKTSPYLEDSDSDGLSDKEEISSGGNPNCPQGQTCGSSAPVEPAVSETATGSPSLGGEAGDTEITEKQLEEILSGEIDGATLRQLLISTGSATTEDLAGISDEDLLRSYQEALKNQSQ